MHLYIAVNSTFFIPILSLSIAGCIPGLLRYAAELDTVGDPVISTNLDKIKSNVRKVLAPPRSPLKAPPAAAANTPAQPPKSPATLSRPAAHVPPPPRGGNLPYILPH